MSLAAALLWAFPALAGDKPATPEGADALKALIAKYLPAAQAGATPLVTVKPDGSHYLVSADLSALNALLAETGISYDPAIIVYQAIEQDDGNWRVAMDSLPKIGFHSKDATRRHRIHELSLGRADQSGHRLASLRLGEHG